MSLYKREGSPYWWYKFHFKGKTIRESSECTDGEEAEQVEAKRKRELFDVHRACRLGIKVSRPWKDAVVEYMKTMPEGTTRTNTLLIVKWLDKYLGDKTLDDIDRPLLIEVRNAKIAEINKKKAKMAAAGKPSRWATAQPSTVNRVLGVVGTIVNYAVNELEWREHPLKVPLLTVIKKEPAWATREKALKLIKTLPKHQIPMVIFALEVGWRRRNVTHLEWSQVDMERRFAWVTPQAAKARKGIPAPLSDTAMKVLEAQQGIDECWVFPYRGKPVEQTSTRAYRRARDAAGLPPEFTWHALRHTWASWCIQGGTPKEILKELGGWKTARMVEHYAHLGAEHLAPYVSSQLPAEVAQQELDGARHKSGHNARIPTARKQLICGNSSVGRAQPCQG